MSYFNFERDAGLGSSTGRREREETRGGAADGEKRGRPVDPFLAIFNGAQVRSF